MKKVEEYYAPWVKGIPMYISDHIEKAWRDPSLHRMMSNENPLPPSDKVLEAMVQVFEDGKPLSRSRFGCPHQDRRDEQCGRSRQCDDRQRLQ